MIKPQNVEVKTSSRIYGDFIEKEAVDFNLTPSAVLGAIAGGYAGTRHFKGQQQEQEMDLQQQRSIENDSYQDVQDLLNNLTIVFTPINVIYRVNDQVFDIINAKEMTPHMQVAFRQRDEEYFKKILFNKVNMELQMAEKVFARRLLDHEGSSMQSNEFQQVHQPTDPFDDPHTKFSFFDEEQVKGMVKEAKDTFKDQTLTIPLSFDSLRPFEQSAFFFNPNEIEKIAGIMDLFQRSAAQTIPSGRFNREINVGFLPDRVVFTWNGQVIEQMSVMKMNSDGYDAFRRKDANFFLDQFKQHSNEIQSSLKNLNEDEITKESADQGEESFYEDKTKVDSEDQTIPEYNDQDDIELVNLTHGDDFEEGSGLLDKLKEWFWYEQENDYETMVDYYSLDAEDEDLYQLFKDRIRHNVDGVEKKASTSSDEDRIAVLERESFDVFQDPDLHPLIYQKILSEYIHPEWETFDDFDAIIKQIEVTFNLPVGLSDQPYNKILVLHTLADPDHMMYMTPLSFEKFARVMNSMSIDLGMFEGNLTLNDVFFAIELAKAMSGEEVFFEFHDKVTEYVSEEFFQDGVRYIPTHAFNQDNPAEKAFFDDLNGLLRRKWVEYDTHSIVDNALYMRTKAESLLIDDIIEEITATFGASLDIEDLNGQLTPYLSHLEDIKELEESRAEAVIYAVINQIFKLVSAISYLELKHQEYEHIMNMTLGGDTDE